MTDTPIDTEFWDHYRSLAPLNTTPERGTEAWKIREQLVADHIYLTKRIVVKIKKRMPAHVEADDLESLANIGLLQAIQRYNHTRGVPFEAFITQRVRSVIGDYVRDQDWAPRSLRTRQREITKVAESFRQNEGRDPGIEEIAEILDTTTDDVSNTLHRAEIATHSYIEGNVEAQNKPSSLDDDEDELVMLLKTVTSKALSTLPIKQATVLALHYYEEQKLSDIAKVLRTSEVKIGQLHSEGVLKIWQQLLSVVQENE